MKNERIFRITDEQLHIISGLLFSSRPEECVYAEYGTGVANYSKTCSRAIVCVKGIETNLVEISKLHDIKQNYCVFINSCSLDHAVSILPVGAICVSYQSDAICAYYKTDKTIAAFDICSVVGHSIKFRFADISDNEADADFSERMAQAFGKGTTEIMSKLTFGIAGASGTGSLVAEQLVRLGAKRLVIVDDDIVEKRNIGRIVNSSMQDAAQSVLKVEMLKREYGLMGLSTEVVAVPSEIIATDAIHLLSGCDVLFGCLDSRDGRNQLNHISTYYCIPYIDVGVRLESKNSQISEISGSIRYIIPGGSSLLSRGTITSDQITSDALRRSDPEAYAARLNEKYIVNASEGSPAVISVNMFYSSLAVLELLARIHNFRAEDNSNIESIYIDLIEQRFCPPDKPSMPSTYLKKFVGYGDTTPLIGLMGSKI